ncbi:coiled-coil domain-containing protein [Helicobacter pylori]|uniref:coiled-coil domain-containing protein n=1 Tax=Helicobacter pylori TaxID=210 RepID=UPI0009584C4E|nr:hypothetical protein [Helicobacter pylori]BAW67341.1 uncharacterized protein HPF90_0725 [Helicobacter pylori]
MDLTNLEKALNNGNFKEQVYSSLEGVYQISKVLNQIDLLKNFSDHDLEIIQKIESIKSALAGYEMSEQELKAKINALVGGLEATKQELEARLNMELTSEKEKIITELTQAKNHLAQELEALKTSLKAELTPKLQGVTKFLGIYVYGRQTLFKNESDTFMELFEFANIHLEANKIYIVEFSMPFELITNGLYSESMGEMVLCLKVNNRVYPIINSFYQNKTANLIGNKIIDTYRATSIFETPSEQADYKIAVFAKKHKDLWVNVNYTANTQGFETSFLNSASFRDLTTQSIPTTYNNDWVFYKHSQALVYEILK